MTSHALPRRKSKSFLCDGDMLIAKSIYLISVMYNSVQKPTNLHMFFWSASDIERLVSKMLQSRRIGVSEIFLSLWLKWGGRNWHVG